jgi:hypothetical protein
VVSRDVSPGRGAEEPAGHTHLAHAYRKLDIRRRSELNTLDCPRRLMPRQLPSSRDCPKDAMTPCGLSVAGQR